MPFLKPFGHKGEGNWLIGILLYQTQIAREPESYMETQNVEKRKRKSAVAVLYLSPGKGVRVRGSLCSRGVQQIGYKRVTEMLPFKREMLRNVETSHWNIRVDSTRGKIPHPPS